MRADLEIDKEEVVIYFIYQPSGVLAPVEGNCETFIETYGYNFFFAFFSSYFSFFFLRQLLCLLMSIYGFLGGGDNIYSGLTFVGVNCEDAVFLNGIAPQQIWFEVTITLPIFSFLFFFFSFFFS